MLVSRFCVKVSDDFISDDFTVDDRDANIEEGNGCEQYIGETKGRLKNRFN